MAAPLARALRLPALLCFLLATAAPAAYAIEERAVLSVGPGGAFYDTEQGLKDGGIFGLGATGFINRWIGIEGIFLTGSPSLEIPAVGDATFTHVGGGLMITPDRYRWTLPYLYGGLGSVTTSQNGGASSNFGAYHFGAGMIVRAGERLGFRLDGQNIWYQQEGGPGRDTRVNTFAISAQVSAFWFGRPRDSDEDGVPDKRDKSPATPNGAIVDASGIPLDTDKDGVYDGLDKSPATPFGAIVGLDGLAIDTDKDGVSDGIDQCDSTVTGVIVDAKGCGIDTDGDKVFDGLDKCSDTPSGSLVDGVGCPLDADGDGVPDGIDTCPYTLAGEAVNAGGCPITPSPREQEMLEEWLIRLTDLEFPPDSALLQPQAIARIDSVGTALVQWPMAKIEIGAHVDDQPEPGFRIPLSQMRVRSVLQYIFKKFPSLSQKNFWITGYGDTDPIVPNTSSANRHLNRRVDFRIMNMNVMYQERLRRASLGSVPVAPAPGLEPRMPGNPEGSTPEPPVAPNQPQGTTPGKP